jgi:hypothetical protein
MRNYLLKSVLSIIAVIAALAVGSAVQAQTVPIQGTVETGTVTTVSWVNVTVSYVANHAVIVPATIGIDLHKRIAPAQTQLAAVIGGGSNFWWKAGITHTTFLRTDVAREQFGIGVTGGWDSAPKWLKYALFNTDNVQWVVDVNENVDGFVHGFRGYDWKDTSVCVGVGRKF